MKPSSLFLNRVGRFVPMPVLAGVTPTPLDRANFDVSSKLAPALMPKYAPVQVKTGSGAT